MATRTWEGGTDGDWSDANNWAETAVPVNGDDVIIADNAVDIDEGLDQSAVALNSLTIEQTYTGQIGTTSAYLQVDSSTVDIGQAYGGGGDLAAGSPRIKLDIGTTASTVTIHNSGASGDTGLQAIRLKCNNAATVVYVLKGSVSIADAYDETSTLSALHISYVDDVESDADVVVGAGVTITTVTKTGGKLVLRCAATTATQRAGDLRSEGSGAITTVNMYDGTATLNSSGTITTLNGYGGEVDTLESRVARTITTLNVYAGFSFAFDQSIVTLTNKPAAQEPLKLVAEAA